MSGNQKQVKRSRKQTARTKRHALRWTAPLLGVYALGAPHGWADTLDATTLESNRTDLQRAILPTAPARRELHAHPELEHELPFTEGVIVRELNTIPPPSKRTGTST